MGEARSHRRLSAAPLLVAYTIGGEYEAARTETYDIGLGGLAMLTAAELHPDTELELELELRGEPGAHLHLHGEVRWCRFDPALQRFRTGVEFVDRTAEQEARLRSYIDTMYRLRDLGVTGC